MKLVRVPIAVGFAAVFFVGAAGDSYEPTHEWLMPLSVVGVGAAIGNWWALWLALGAIPYYILANNGVTDDPPPTVVIYIALLGALLLALGVGFSKVAFRPH